MKRATMQRTTRHTPSVEAGTAAADGASDTTVDTVLVLGPAGPSTNTTVGA